MGLLQTVQINIEKEDIKKLFPGVKSFLWAADLSNYRENRIQNIIKEVFRIAPCNDSRHYALLRFVEVSMKQIRWDMWHQRITKPHRADLYKAAKLESIRQTGQAKRKVKHIRKELDILKVSCKFSLELGIVLLDEDTPKNESEYNQECAVMESIIKKHEKRGDFEKSRKTKDSMPEYEPTFKEVAERIKKRYLKEYPGLPRQNFRKELQDRIRTVRNTLYPDRNDIRPKRLSP